eukprot:6464353-Amphidinium_carterae.1
MGQRLERGCSVCCLACTDKIALEMRGSIFPNHQKNRCTGIVKTPQNINTEKSMSVPPQHTPHFLNVSMVAELDLGTQATQTHLYFVQRHGKRTQEVGQALRSSATETYPEDSTTTPTTWRQFFSNSSRGCRNYYILAMLVTDRALTKLRAAPQGNGLEVWRQFGEEWEPRHSQRSCPTTSMHHWCTT